jgi:hypothetical protein
MVILPFNFTGLLLSSLFAAGKSDAQPMTDYSGLTEKFAGLLHESVNRVYAGKVTGKKSESDTVSVEIEAFYGINIPGKEIIRDVAPKLHISEKNIIFMPLTARKSIYSVASGGLTEYDQYRKLCLPFDSFPELFQRIMLRTPGFSTEPGPGFNP